MPIYIIVGNGNGCLFKFMSFIIIIVDITLPYHTMLLGVLQSTTEGEKADPGSPAPDGSPWLLMDPHGSSWIPMDPHGSPWIPMAPHESLWITMCSISLYYTPTIRSTLYFIPLRIFRIEHHDFRPFTNSASSCHQSSLTIKQGISIKQKTVDDKILDLLQLFKFSVLSVK